MSINNNKKTSRYITLALVICFFAGGYFLFQNNKVEAQKILNDLRLIPRPETFTELYFENFATLPKHSVAGQTLNFTFTVHNLEGKTMSYPYIAYFQYSTSSPSRFIFKQGTIVAQDNDYKSVNINHVFSTSDLNGKVVVELTNLNQQIDFILPNNN